MIHMLDIIYYFAM